MSLEQFPNEIHVLALNQAVGTKTTKLQAHYQLIIGTHAQRGKLKKS